ncbi:hypothetical protein SUGI_0682830 [Cryptomeria japonica]|nr:hypothetical protein SUGI_0682830 [Cryptomeria japonica]
MLFGIWGFYTFSLAYTYFLALGKNKGRDLGGRHQICSKFLLSRSHLGAYLSWWGPTARKEQKKGDLPLREQRTT